MRHKGLLLCVAALTALAAMRPVGAQQSLPPGMCRVSGAVSSSGIPIPGVAVLAKAGDTTVAGTSSEADGTFQLIVKPGVYTLSAELTGFSRAARDIDLATECSPTVDFQLSLPPRSTTTPAPGANAAAQAQGRGARPSQPFETLAVQGQQGAPADATPDRESEEAAARQLLPPGFSTDAPAQALAFSGNMASVDRGLMGERFDAMGRGEIDPVTGELPPGFGTPGASGAPGGFGGRGGPGGRGAGRGGPGGGGRGDFALGGRGGRQNTFTATATYTYGGSALDAAPYQLRPDAPASRAPYNRQSFGATVGGPLRIPGVYDGTRRTNFTVTYGGNRGDELFDQYATVPTDAMRSGNFSAVARQLLDPDTGLPLPGNQIPPAMLDPAAVALLTYIPLANVPGGTRNFHHTSTTDSLGDSLNVRLTHNFTPGAAGARGGPVRGGFGARGGGRGGRGLQGTSVLLNAQVQARRTDNERLNVFPTLGGRATNSSLSAPIGLNIARRRTLHTINVNYSRTNAATTNQYAYTRDVAGEAGIDGVSADPFAWGVPDLSFGTFSSVRDIAPSERRDRRLSSAYTWSRPVGRHTLRLGGDYRWDKSSNRTDANARGAFVFTGLYASGSGARGDGLDFADFLLGLPQQASVNYGPGNVTLTGRSMSVFVQDDWRKSSSLTLNLGLRYELLWPFVEEQERMVNLDATPAFTAVAPVMSGGTGPFTGSFPTALLNTDFNNIAPRVGAAWRIRPGTVLRGGYGLAFNSGSYSTIARSLVSQPPFAVTSTAVGTLDGALSLTDPLATASPAGTTNNYGVQRDYALGNVQTWNVDLNRELRQIWSVGAGYTHTRGSSLDIVRAPNRDPDGLRIEGVQPFLWQSSEGSSILHAATFRLRKRPARGLGGGVTYTLAKSRDNASTIGGGATVVAQDDRNLGAEWGLSSFDRRHQLSADVSVELPFGENRPWLNNGGVWATLLQDWRASTTFTWQSGTPYTPRIRGAAADVARGTNGTLRATYSGAPVQVNDPTIDLFFNTTAFTVPAPGTFGDALRNMIIGPGSRQLNAQLSRDIRLRQSRTMSIQLNATNLLNMVNYGAVDTIVNSPTFGQVLSVRPMRSMQLNLRFRF